MKSLIFSSSWFIPKKLKILGEDKFSLEKAFKWLGIKLLDFLNNDIILFNG